MFISCSSKDNGGRPIFVGTIERWSNKKLGLPKTKCVSNISLYVLVLHYLVLVVTVIMIKQFDLGLSAFYMRNVMFTGMEELLKPIPYKNISNQ